jgi:2-succinyl-5-enolpyruvyl-6-hydroxy-3-cyclohexene-1-carboxylate synthase
MTATSPQLAVAIVEQLIGSGVRDVVLAPGSRSSPLALALAAAERASLLRLHVRIDERSAAYLAVGIARVARRPCAVVTTSGTAAVNLHPAVVEAAYSGVPLVAVTADRPGSMRGSGANQTIDQRDLFGPDVVAAIDVEGMDSGSARAAVARAIRAAVGAHPGPVHLNVPLTEPLVAPGAHGIDAAPVELPARAAVEGDPLGSLLPDGVSSRRGLVVAGDFDDPHTLASAADLADSLRWPLISEPTGNLSDHPRALRHGPMLIPRALELGATPDVVVTIGRVGLHRSVSALLRAAQVHVAVDVPPLLGRVDPVRTATVIVPAVPVAGHDADADESWWSMWHDWDVCAARVIDEELADGPLTGPLVARIVSAVVTEADLLVTGPSWSVRHVSCYAGALKGRCVANRGTSGIDGVISTAWGAAIGHADGLPGATTYALVGDLTAIYDRNGLLVPQVEALPRLVYVVADNDGGGIFSSLEQGAEEFAADFERVFGTPLSADMAELLCAPRIDVMTVDSADALRGELRRDHAGVRVIVARCLPRTDEARLVSALTTSVDAAIT